MTTGTTLFELTRAFVLKTEMDTVEQPVVYMLAAFLRIVGDAELSYHLMLRLWNNLNWKRHFQCNDGDYTYCHEAIKELSNYIDMCRP